MRPVKAVEFASPAAKPAMQKNLDKIKRPAEPPAMNREKTTMTGTSAAKPWSDR